MLRLVADEQEPRAYALISGELNIGVLRLEVESADESPTWFYSIFALHLVDSGVQTTGSAANIGDAFAEADQCWSVIVRKLGLQPLQAV